MTEMIRFVGANATLGDTDRSTRGPAPAVKAINTSPPPSPTAIRFMILLPFNGR
jgi:hypothetical protein